MSESTPGPVAINLATYIGFKKRKFLGALFFNNWGNYSIIYCYF
ncbi:MAG: chromate transporter [Clostridium sp.]|nr:MAG: chromate transporter [Clostridium sp.]